MVTGTTVGTWAIVPAAFMSNNFDISYELGDLTILPAQLTVTANNLTITEGQSLAFTSNITGYWYDDDASIIESGPSYFIYDNMNNLVTGNPGPGTYSIVPGNLVLNSPANYTVNYLSGTLTVLPSASCTLTEPSLLPVCGLGNNTLTASVSGNAASYSWSVTGTGWQITSGQGTSSITYKAGNSGTTGTFTLVVGTGPNSTCTVSFGNRCEEYCAYSQGFWGNPGSSSCGMGTSCSLLPTLLTTPLVTGAGTRTITFGTTESSCLQSKLPAGGTVAALPSGNKTCAQATGTSYLQNGKFKNNLLGQTIALSLAIRLNPSLGNVRITGTYITTYAASSCVNGTAVTGTKQVKNIPSAVVNYLGVNNRITDLLNLANAALGCTYSGSSPTLSQINTAVCNIIAAFEQCRIFVGFSNSSSGLRLIENEPEELTNNMLHLSVHPNPSDEYAVLTFPTEFSGQTEIALFDLQGRRIAGLFYGEWPGYESVELNTSELTPGIYLIKLSNNGESVTARLVVVR